MNDLFPDNSRVWIYAADHKIPEELNSEVRNKIQRFIKNWNSHNQELRASGDLLHQYFIVFFVDELFNKPGGCSIDSSVKFVKALGEELQIDFFNRNNFYYLKEKNVELIEKDNLESLVAKGFIDDNTLFFDTLVQTKLAFNNWLRPWPESWQKKYFGN